MKDVRSPLWVKMLITTAAVAAFVLMMAELEAASPPVVPGQVACTVSECVKYQQTLIWTETGKVLNFSWGNTDVNQTTGAYEFRIVKFPPDATAAVVTSRTVAPNVRSQQWSPQKAGWYYAEVRACNIKTPALSDCSRYSQSISPIDVNQTVDPRGWFIYVKLAKPTGGGIE